jgi:TonB-dependent SusC/RagA subfamily outer membrane receptor
MPTILLYLLKCSISLSIVWLFYQLLLRRLTFYSMNRWYLIGYAALSFLLPLIHIALPSEEKMAGNMQVIRYIPVITVKSSAAASGARDMAYTGWDMLLAVLVVGALLLLVRLLIRCLSLRRIQKGAVLIGDSHVAIYHVNEPIIPFSFGKAIYINPRLHSEKECEEIILHEYVHVRERHTVDILVGEALCILSWFNPFSWLIRHSIRQNLEFIADRQVLASGLDKKAYQYHLLKVVGESRYRLANNFNFSSLKKRIIMMNKSRSARLHLVKFLFIVPLLGVLLVAFRDKVDIHLPDFHKQGFAPAIDNAAPVSSVRIDTARHLRDTAPSSGPSASRKDMDSVKPMFIIDEVESSQGGMNKLHPQDILFVDILKNESSVATFGPAAKGGVVLIFTKAYGPHRKNEVLLKNGKRVKLAVPDPPPPRATSPGTMPPDGMPALRDTLSDRHLGKTDTIRVPIRMQDLGLVEESAIRAAKDVADTSPYKAFREALIIVDGKPWTYEEVQKIDPQKIQSISILRDKSAEAIYGPKAKNGVVLITLRSPAVKSKGQSVSITTDEDGTTTMKADTIHYEPITAH